MIVVRYAALAALVIWLGVMIVDLWVGAVAVDVLRSIRLVAYGSGGVIMACLFVMKFVGPPPPAFMPRAAIVAAMLLVAAGSAAAADRDQRLPIALNTVLAFALLGWYVRE